MKKLQNLRNKFINGRKENKGFTLVELIVVIVILAILIGVTIGGVFTYVNKSRTNTDINNASAITSSLSVITTVSDAKPLAADGKPAPVTKSVDIAGMKGDEVATALNLSNTDNPLAYAKVTELLPDGVPASKTGGKFMLTTTVDATGTITSIKVTATKSDGKTKLEGVE